LFSLSVQQATQTLAATQPQRTTVNVNHCQYPSFLPIYPFRECCADVVGQHNTRQVSSFTRLPLVVYPPPHFPCRIVLVVSSLKVWPRVPTITRRFASSLSWLFPARSLEIHSHSTSTRGIVECVRIRFNLNISYLIVILNIHHKTYASSASHIPPAPYISRQAVHAHSGSSLAHHCTVTGCSHSSLVRSFSLISLERSPIHYSH